MLEVLATLIFFKSFVNRIQNQMISHTMDYKGIIIDIAMPFVFETGPYSVAQAGLEFTVQFRSTFNSGQSFCVSLWGAGIMNMSHQAWLSFDMINKTSSWIVEGHLLSSWETTGAIQKSLQYRWKAKEKMLWMCAGPASSWDVRKTFREVELGQSLKYKEFWKWERWV